MLQTPLKYNPKSSNVVSTVCLNQAGDLENIMLKKILVLFSFLVVTLNIFAVDSE